MKTKEIAKSNGLDPKAFDGWLKQSGYEYKSSMTGGLTVADNTDADALVGIYNQYLAEEQERLADEQTRLAEEQANAERAAMEKQQDLASMLVTSGFNFDGYTITKYSGYISGDSAIQVERPTENWFGSVKGSVGDGMMEALVQIRRQALLELKEAAYEPGCNAVIGVDFDYLTLDPESVNSSGGTLYLPFLFGVTANGNAVTVEKRERTALG